VTSTDRHRNETAIVADLVQSVVRERAALHVDLAAVERMARSTGHAALVQRVGLLRTSLRQQLNLLDAVLEIVTTDEPS
jgi:hypothetical protein